MAMTIVVECRVQTESNTDSGITENVNSTVL